MLCTQLIYASPRIGVAYTEIGIIEIQTLPRKLSPNAPLRPHTPEPPESPRQIIHTYKTEHRGPYVPTEQPSRDTPTHLRRAGARRPSCVRRRRWRGRGLRVAEVSSVWVAMKVFNDEGMSDASTTTEETRDMNTHRTQPYRAACRAGPSAGSRPFLCLGT